MIFFQRCINIMARNPILSETLKFDNKVLKFLPIDPVITKSERQVKDACFSLTEPDPVKNPKIVAYSIDALKLLGFSEEILINNIEELTPYLCGNLLFTGSRPAAHCYCGHQFGNFAGQLGDGAAMYLGEVINKEERWEIQIKGAGKTPYSRFSDGRKVLRSSLREFLCSEAMHYLNIPTTRAGSIVTSDSRIERDMFYDGHPKMERCSVVMRIAPTFLRFGSFEICKPLDLKTGRHGPSSGNVPILLQMLDYVIESFYSEIWQKKESDPSNVNHYLEFYKEIVRRTAVLVAKWQSVGFCHGVLNTDNMSIVGITIDYGPFGFLERYEPGHVCNASDTGSRYSYQQQPSVCRWNCQKLAEALRPAMPQLLTQETTNKILEDQFDVEYRREYLRLMSNKIGMEYDEQNESLIETLLNTMHRTGADFTNTFVALQKILEHAATEVGASGQGLDHSPLVEHLASLEELKTAFEPKLSKEDRQFFWMMAGNQRSKLIEMGGQFLLDEEEKEKYLEMFKAWTEADKVNHDEVIWTEWLIQYRTALEAYWSSGSATVAVTHSVQRMAASNPRVVLRNHVAQFAIDAAEKSQHGIARQLLQLLRSPFQELPKLQSPNNELDRVCAGPPSNGAFPLKVS